MLAANSIIKTYNDILAADPDLTKPVAAINALIALLNTVKTSTVMETMATLREHSKTLRRSVKNPVPLFAGIDLFTQVLIKSFEGQGPDFEATKEHLLRNGRLFAQRAVDARNGMAERGQELVREGKTVLTHGASRSVTTLLARAARERAGKFKVIYVREEARAEESDRVVAELRSHGIPTAEIDPSSVAHVLSLGKEVHMVFVGAEAVTNSGGIISRMGTLGIAQAAATARIPLYVAVESHKFVRRFVMDQKDLGFEQDALDFSVAKPSERLKDAVDYTVLLSPSLPQTPTPRCGFLCVQTTKVRAN